MTAAALALVLTACPKRPVDPGDSGVPSKPDAGPAKDAGDNVPPWVRQTDAGYVYLERYAGEKCPDEAYSGLVDGVQPDGGEFTVLMGVCVATRQMSGLALLNGKPVVGVAEIHWEAAQYDSQIREPITDPMGRYAVNVMRTRYDLLKYHPDGIWANHKGFQEFGYVDMSKDQTRDLKVTSHSLRGSAFFGGLPFTSVQFPPDVYFRAAGSPPDQHAGSMSVGGSYELALMDGTMAVLLNTPPDALQGTELIDYPITWSYTLSADQQLDVNIPASELEGQITIDGLPIPDRKMGTDFELNYTPSGEETVVASTHHEGGIASFHSLIPKGRYSVTLSFDAVPDRHLPAQVFNRQVAQQVDLNNNAQVSRDFVTFPIEGGITIDGKSPTVNPGYNWVLYMYGYASATEPWFFVYYKVPLESGAFTLRAFPAVYYVAIQLGDDLAPDLVDGFHRVARQKEIKGADSLPIEIETSLFTGRILIDGRPPPVGKEAGTVTLRQSDQTFTKRIWAAEDGEFKLRVPKGAYEVFFTINKDTYPRYASGRERMLSRVELFEDNGGDLIYDTVPVQGPIRLGGKVIDDVLGDDDVQLYMRRRQDSTWWVWGFPGGSPSYSMRVPSGLYDMWFNILPDAVPHTAWGDAPLGYQLPAFSPYVAPPPGR